MEIKPVRDKIVYGTKGGEILMNEHILYELVKIADARGGSRVLANWLQNHKGDEQRRPQAVGALDLGQFD